MEAVLHVPEIHIRQMAGITADSLVAVNKAQLQTVETFQVTFRPTDKPRTREESLDMGRDTAAHRGHLPAGFKKIVAGTGHPEKDKQKRFGDGSTRWYKCIQIQRFSDLYGEGSFLQEYMRVFVSLSPTGSWRPRSPKMRNWA